MKKRDYHVLQGVGGDPTMRVSTIYRDPTNGYGLKTNDYGLKTNDYGVKLTAAK